MVDLWKARNGRHYVGVVVSFITDDWEYHTVALGAIPIDVRHTAANIRSVVQKLLLEFAIVPTVYVADNASNQVKCNDLLADWSNDYFADNIDEDGTASCKLQLLTDRTSSQ